MASTILSGYQRRRTAAVLPNRIESGRRWRGGQDILYLANDDRSQDRRKIASLSYISQRYAEGTIRDYRHVGR